MNILSFSGFVPEQICDTVRFIRYRGECAISHYCGYAADFISQVLQDPAVDGAVYPRTCDSSRVMCSYLEDCGKFSHQIIVPARQDDRAAAYLASEIRRYQAAVKAYYGIGITDIAERITLVNARNRALRKRYGSLTDISYAAYLNMIHHLLQTPLRDQTVKDNFPGKLGNGRRVFLVGSLLPNAEIAVSIEEAGMAIVGDRLTESKRLFSAPEVSAEGDLYENIARSILRNQVSPSQNRFEAILREDLAELKEKRVQGVIFVTQKFCEPYDYLFPAYQRMLDEQGIPVLRLVLNGTEDSRGFDASLEAFADML